MRIKIKRFKIYKSEVIFVGAYICFFLALFLGDTAIEPNIIQFIAKILRYVSYILALIQILVHSASVKHFLLTTAIFSISMLFFIFTKDIYLPMLILLIASSKDTSEAMVLNISLILLVVGTVLVILGCLVGLIPDVLTAKAFSDELARHSLGFYHSNVLPNNLVTIEIFLIWKHREKLSNFYIIMFFVLHLIVYVLSVSRMCLVIGIALTGILFFLKSNTSFRKNKKLFALMAYCIAPVCSILSIALMFLVKNNMVAQKIDILFSCRFSISYSKMCSVGLKIFNFNSNDVFYNDGLVLDNGYLFVLLRFGFIAVGALCVIGCILTRKYKMYIFKLICLFCVFSMAFIDNLFLSYRFLPFLILAFVNKNQISSNK